MFDGLCACGTCLVPGYAEARDFANHGAVGMITVEPDGLHLSGYVPTVEQLEVFLHEDERIRSAGHIALMVKTQGMKDTV